MVSGDFEISAEQAQLVYAALKAEQDPVTGGLFVRKLNENYAKYSKGVKGQAASQAVDVIGELESKGLVSMVDVLGKASLNSAKNVPKVEVEEVIRYSYKGIGDPELEGIMGLLAVTAKGDIEVEEIQSFLKKYTAAKKVSFHSYYSLPLRWR